MLHLIREWLICRTLDDGRPVPPSHRGHERLVIVHEALRDRAGAHLRQPPADFRARTIEAVRRASRAPAAHPRRPFAALHLTMAGILVLCGMIGIYTLIAPQNLPVTPHTGSAGRSGAGTASSFGSSFAPRHLSDLWGGLPRPSIEAIQTSLEAPVRLETRQLISDARRAADMILDRLPFMTRGESR
jgi:hypothetical protein